MDLEKLDEAGPDDLADLVKVKVKNGEALAVEVLAIFLIHEHSQ